MLLATKAKSEASISLFYASPNLLIFYTFKKEKEEKNMLKNKLSFSFSFFLPFLFLFYLEEGREREKEKGRETINGKKKKTSSGQIFF